MPGLMFVEATVVYHEVGRDPRDPLGKRSERRLFNLESVGLIVPTADGSGHSVFHMRPPSSAPFFVVLEPYEYWSAILTSGQPRKAA